MNKAKCSPGVRVMNTGEREKEQDTKREKERCRIHMNPAS